MADKVNMSEVIKEIKGASEEELRTIIEGWYEKTHTDGMKLGAKYISLGIFGAMKKHLGKGGKPTLRDHERLTADIRKIISVQMTESEDEDVAEDVVDD